VSKKSKFTRDYQEDFSSLTYRIGAIGYLIQFSNMELPPSQSEMYGIGEMIRMITREMEEMKNGIQFSALPNPSDQKRGSQ
jgi:hypothetical protein